MLISEAMKHRLFPLVALKRFGVKTASLDVEKIQAEYDAMTAQKAKLKKIYQTAEKEAEEADKQLKNIRQYLGLERDTRENKKLIKSMISAYKKERGQYYEFNV